MQSLGLETAAKSDICTYIQVPNCTLPKSTHSQQSELRKLISNSENPALSEYCIKDNQVITKALTNLYQSYLRLSLDIKTMGHSSWRTSSHKHSTPHHFQSGYESQSLADITAMTLLQDFFPLRKFVYKHFCLGELSRKTTKVTVNK